jgi:hypothetical protein
MPPDVANEATHPLSSVRDTRKDRIQLAGGKSYWKCRDDGEK